LRRIDIGASRLGYSSRDIDRGEGATGRPQKAVEQEACIIIESRDRPRRVDGTAKVPKALGLASGSSNVVRVPLLARTKLCVAKLASLKVPVMTPAGLMATACRKDSRRDVRAKTATAVHEEAPPKKRAASRAFFGGRAP
jgi:hypothetical protein